MHGNVDAPKPLVFVITTYILLCIRYIHNTHGLHPHTRFMGSVSMRCYSFICSCCMFGYQEYRCLPNVKLTLFCDLGFEWFVCSNGCGGGRRQGLLILG